MTDKLKPCPKCGGQAKIWHVGDYKQYFIVRCKECSYTPFEFHGARPSEEKAIKWWNKEN